MFNPNSVFTITAKHIDGLKLVEGVLAATAAAHHSVQAEMDGGEMLVHGLDRQGYETYVASIHLSLVGSWPLEEEGTLSFEQLRDAGITLPTNYEGSNRF